MKRPLLWNEILQGRNKIQGPKIHKNVHHFCTFTSIEITIHCYVIFNIVEASVKVEPLDRTINSQKASDSFEKQIRCFQAYATAYRQLILTKLSLNVWILPSPLIEWRWIRKWVNYSVISNLISFLVQIKKVYEPPTFSTHDVCNISVHLVAGRLGFYSQSGHTKDFKNSIRSFRARRSAQAEVRRVLCMCCSSCYVP